MNEKTNKIITKKYYFSVEGETEKWYFDHLQQLINNSSSKKFKVSIDCKVEKNPLKRVKSLNIFQATEITHVFDYENDANNIQFENVLKLMKEAASLGKDITYKLGYNNLSFELWIILHKKDCNTSFSDVIHYLKQINAAYNESFKDMKEFKKEGNFKHILETIFLPDVQAAVKRGKIITENNIRDTQIQKIYGYKYFRKNPSLSIWESIDRILKDCL